MAVQTEPILNVVLVLYIAVIAATAFLALRFMGRILADLISGIRAWSVRQRRDREAAPGRAFPVVLPIEDEGEGAYLVSGVLRANEAEVDWTIPAKTRANAIAKAELRGMVVTNVRKLRDEVAEGILSEEDIRALQVSEDGADVAVRSADNFVP